MDFVWVRRRYIQSHATRTLNVPAEPHIVPIIYAGPALSVHFCSIQYVPYCCCACFPTRVSHESITNHPQLPPSKFIIYALNTDTGTHKLLWLSYLYALSLSLSVSHRIHLDNCEGGTDNQLRLGRDEWRPFGRLFAVLEDAGNTIGFGEQCRIDDSEAETGGKSVFCLEKM